MEQIQKIEHKSRIKIENHDKTVRIINVIGLYDQTRASQLAIDIEGDNYKHVEVIKYD